jgi:hypothetical protein
MGLIEKKIRHGHWWIYLLNWNNQHIKNGYLKLNQVQKGKTQVQSFNVADMFTNSINSSHVFSIRSFEH